MKKTLTAQTSQGQLRATVTTERNHFSVTGEIGSKSDPHTCGCIHEEILTAFPHLRPVVDLHLSDLDGVPMYAEANGWYWLAKALGIPEKYEPENSPEHCKRIFSNHIRADAGPVMERVKAAYKSDTRLDEKSRNAMARHEWGRAMDEMKPRWKEEAEAGLALIESL